MKCLVLWTYDYEGVLLTCPSADFWTGGVHVVDGLPSCDPGWGGGQSEVDTEGSVEVEVVLTVCAVLVFGVELGVVVGYCKKLGILWVEICVNHINNGNKHRYTHIH